MNRPGGLLDTDKVTALLPILQVAPRREPAKRTALGRPPAASDCGVTLPALAGSSRFVEEQQQATRTLDEAVRKSAIPRRASESTTATAESVWPGHPLARRTRQTRRRRSSGMGPWQAGQTKPTSMPGQPEDCAGLSELCASSLQRFYWKGDRCLEHVVVRGGWAGTKPVAEVTRKFARMRRQAVRDAAVRGRGKAHVLLKRERLAIQRWREAREARESSSESDSSEEDYNVNGPQGDHNALAQLRNVKWGMLQPQGSLDPGTFAFAEVSQDAQDSREVSKLKLLTRAVTAVRLLQGRFSAAAAPQPQGPAPSLGADVASGLGNMVRERRKGFIVMDHDAEEESNKKSVAKHRITMINSLETSRKKKCRVFRLLEQKRQEFAQKSAEEQELLQVAFLIADPEQTGVTMPKRLKKAFDHLGFTAKTDAEKREIKILLEEFSAVSLDFFVFAFETVPRARKLLRDLRRAPLLQDFMFYDADASGSLDEEECALILQRLCSWNLDAIGLAEMNQAFQAIFDDVKVEGDVVDFDGFEGLVSRAQEQYNRIQHERERDIMEQEGLPENILEKHWNELVFFFNCFTREASDVDEEDDTRRANLEDVRRMLAEFCPLGHTVESQNTLRMFYVEVTQSTDNAVICFEQFLKFVRRLREWIRYTYKEDLQAMFNRFDKDRSGELSISEVNALLTELRLTPRSREDQGMLKRLLSHNNSVAGQVTFPEFQGFVQMVSERVRSMAFVRERTEGLENGFSDKEISELRDVFMLLCQDQPGVLMGGEKFVMKIEELRHILDILRKPLSGDDLRELLDLLDAEKKDGLNFEQFLPFMRTVLNLDCSHLHV